MIFIYKANAQSIENKQNNSGQLALAVYVPDQIDNMPAPAHSMLTNRLGLIVSQAGMAGSSENERFIITAHINVASKDITPTAPPMTALNLDITVVVGDGISGKIFSTTLINTKGVGENETKAYIQAIKNINPSNPILQNTIEKAKLKIIDYYNNNCDMIIKEAQLLANQNKFDEAIFNLMHVPNACTTCYNKCLATVGIMYKRKIDKECQTYLTNARSLWAATQNLNSATDVGNILSNIDPQAACYNEVKVFVNEIAKRIKELDQREWDYKLKELDANVDVAKANLQAWSEVSKAYANSQPKIVYHISGW